MHKPILTDPTESSHLTLDSRKKMNNGERRKESCKGSTKKTEKMMKANPVGNYNNQMLSVLYSIDKCCGSQPPTNPLAESTPKEEKSKESEDAYAAGHRRHYFECLLVYVLLSQSVSPVL